MAGVEMTGTIEETTLATAKESLRLLVYLSAQNTEDRSSGVHTFLLHLAEALRSNTEVERPTEFFVASSGIALEDSGTEGFYPLYYAANAVATPMLTHTAEDYRRAATLLQESDFHGCLMLGGEAQTLEVSAVAEMLRLVLNAKCDLVLPRYMVELDERLVNSSILYPLSRALFGVDVRTPLAIDLAMSPRMLQRMGAAAAKTPAAAQATALQWPVAEAAAAGFSLGEVLAGRREEPYPIDLDFKEALAQVAGSLFSDIEAKAAYWQRNRPSPGVTLAQGTLRPSESANAVFEMHETASLVDSFRQAYANLHELWALVLPPNSLLGLKKLSLMPEDNFRMTDVLWVRVVYDFVLAHRLRTINRGHLLGALTPLYLAWVASYLQQCRTAGEAQRSIDALALAFEADKPYLVSRWRWPDRFNP